MRAGTFNECQVNSFLLSDESDGGSSKDFVILFLLLSWLLLLCLLLLLRSCLLLLCGRSLLLLGCTSSRVEGEVLEGCDIAFFLDQDGDGGTEGHVLCAGLEEQLGDVTFFLHFEGNCSFVCLNGSQDVSGLDLVADLLRPFSNISLNSYKAKLLFPLWAISWASQASCGQGVRRSAFGIGYEETEKFSTLAAGRSFHGSFEPSA